MSSSTPFNKTPIPTPEQAFTKKDKEALDRATRDVKRKLDKKKHKKIILCSTLIPISAAGLTTGIVFGVKSCNKPQPQPEEKIEYIKIPIDKEYVPTIKPTETIYPKDVSGVVLVNKDYFESESTTTLIKEDITGYLKTYIDKWQDVSLAKQWLKENLPDVYDWLIQQFGSEALLANIDKITAATVGFGDIKVVTPNMSNAISPYKLSTTKTVNFGIYTEASVPVTTTSVTKTLDPDTGEIVTVEIPMSYINWTRIISGQTYYIVAE